ncbi:Uncharacterized protein FKW44_010498, partial [Caligus rogercresseyi]
HQRTLHRLRLCKTEQARSPSPGRPRQTPQGSRPKASSRPCRGPIHHAAPKRRSRRLLLILNQRNLSRGDLPGQQRGLQQRNRGQLPWGRVTPSNVLGIFSLLRSCGSLGSRNLCNLIILFIQLKHPAEQHELPPRISWAIPKLSK